MKVSTTNSATWRLERLLAGVLHYGTGLASMVIAAGLALPLIKWNLGISAIPWGIHIVTAGIALFILLPVLRVTLMLIVFVRDGDYRFSAIAAFVLAIIFLGFALGLHAHTGAH